MPLSLRTGVKLAAALCAALLTAAAWLLYQHPAMGFLLGTLPFCG